MLATLGHPYNVFSGIDRDVGAITTSSPPIVVNDVFYHDRANTTLCGLAYGKPLFSLSPLNPPFDVLNGGPVGVRNKVGVGLLDDLGRVT